MLTPEFHSTRKELRKLINLLQIRAVLHANEASYAELSNWFMLNAQLGEINDTALTNANGEKNIYKLTTVSLDYLLLSQVLEQIK